MLAVAVALAFIVLTNSNNAMKTLRNVLVVATVICVLLFSGVAGSFFSSMSVTDRTYGSGTAVRIAAVDYYWNAFLDNPFFASGFTSDDTYPKVQDGPRNPGDPRGLFCYTDVGVVGLLAQFGLFTIPVYIWPLFYMGSVAWRIWKNRLFRKEYELFIGIFAYVIMTGQTLIITNASRIYLLPLILSMYCYVDNVMKQDKCPSAVPQASSGSRSYALGSRLERTRQK